MQPETDEVKVTVGFEWAGKHVGKRHRIGLIQGGGEKMTLYGQLDSVGDKICMQTADWSMPSCALIV
ncbi:hypothetical protein WH50_17210 [Pokkaliibacter plantistimulans]|uniref:Uncharacterized protein n=2 Tax=Pokkaliibacter plantistimulans TaxID=1635171 RepID=A0ABX5LTV9_9GAMM|nr:hypothetical protein WH50_17210 [Pokkaliibacter plantistimulans]